MTARLRRAAPTFLGRLAVTSVTDLAGGSRDLPPSDVLGYRLGRARVVIRPSGTEPKIKAYLEVVEPVPPGRLDQARRVAATRLDPLRAAVTQPPGRVGKRLLGDADDDVRGLDDGVTSLPGDSASSLAASTVIDATSRTPPASSSTLAVASPRVTPVTRALI